MTPLTEKMAREIISDYGGKTTLGFHSIHPNAKAYFIAEGFLAGIEAERKRTEKLVNAAHELLIRNYANSKCYEDSDDWFKELIALENELKSHYAAEEKP